MSFVAGLIGSIGSGLGGAVAGLGSMIGHALVEIGKKIIDDCSCFEAGASQCCFYLIIAIDR